MIGASTVICGVNSSVARATAAGLGGEDRVLEHRLVELEADLPDVAGLLVAEQVARAADVEIVAGELETRAKAVELASTFSRFSRRLGDRAVLRRGQVGIGAQLRSPDAAAQLVELREAEAVGAMDDEGVGARDVEPALDDRRREQHVVLALVEGAHPLLDLGRAHLPVRGDELHFGHVLAQPLFESGMSAMRGTTMKLCPPR